MISPEIYPNITAPIVPFLHLRLMKKMTKMTKLIKKPGMTKGQGRDIMSVSYFFVTRSLIYKDMLQYSWFHFIFAIAAMYVAMLLTDWCVFLVLLLASST